MEQALDRWAESLLRHHAMPSSLITTLLVPTHTHLLPQYYEAVQQ